MLARAVAASSDHAKTVIRFDAEAADVQPASALNAIRPETSVLPALLLVAARVVAWFCPFTRARHTEIARQLAGRGLRRLLDASLLVL
jgi:Na+/melibiose symporter-like transporter